MMMPIRRLLLVLFLAACGGESGPSDDTGGPLMQKAPTSGDGQVGEVATTLPQPLRVLVLQDGVPLAGKEVVFTPAAGVGAVAPVRDTTGADGIASTNWTLGTNAGTGTVRASASGVSGGPLQFSATLHAAAPASIFRESGDGQAQLAGGAFEGPLTVRVVDRFGNAIGGATVAWTISSGPAVVSAPTSVTAADGRTTMGATAGGTLGPVGVTATVIDAPAVTTTFGLAVVASVENVGVANNFFSPAAITVPAGGAVRWSWVAGTHNVAQIDGPVSFLPSPVQMAGASYGPMLFSVAGTYHYECSLHEGMTGTITVVDPAPAPPGE